MNEDAEKKTPWALIALAAAGFVALAAIVYYCASETESTKKPRLKGDEFKEAMAAGRAAKKAGAVETAAAA
jgi:hypothetical protein